MSVLTDALDELAATLVTAGETVADSAAAIRPPVAVIDPPTVSTVNGTIFTVDWLVTLTEQPPGSDRALRRLLDRVAAIGAVLPISSATPTVYAITGTDLPAVALTIQQTYRGDPVVPIPNTPLSAYEDSPIEESPTQPVVTGAIAHEYGNWVEMIASTSEAADYVYLYAYMSANNTNTATVVEIGLGPSGSETAILSGLAIGGWAAPYVRLPLTIPSGSRVSVRTAGVIPSRSSNFNLTISARSALVAPSRPTSTVYGVDASTSAAVVIGTSATEIGVLDVAAAEIAIVPSLAYAGTQGGGTPTYWEVLTGPSGSETVLGVISFDRTTTEAVAIGISQVSRTTFPGVFPAGTRFSARIIVGSATNVGAALIAFHN